MNHAYPRTAERPPQSKAPPPFYLPGAANRYECRRNNPSHPSGYGFAAAPASGRYDALPVQTKARISRIPAPPQAHAPGAVIQLPGKRQGAPRNPSLLRKRPPLFLRSGTAARRFPRSFLFFASSNDECRTHRTHKPTGRRMLAPHMHWLRRHFNIEASAPKSDFHASRSARARHRASAGDVPFESTRSRRILGSGGGSFLCPAAL